MEKKLTLVSFACRRCIVTAFIMLPMINGKAVMSNSTLDELFWRKWGFTPQPGDTIQHL